MAVRYIAPRGTVPSGGNAQSPSTACNGLADAQARGASLSSAGDTWELLADKGPYGAADRAAYGASATSGGLAANAVTGIALGTNYGTTSSFAGRIITGQGPTGQAVIDLGSVTATNQRGSAALYVRGEGIVVRGLRIKAQKFNYLNVTSSTGVPFASEEQVSFENCALVCAGNGMTIEDNDLDGNDGFSRAALQFFQANKGIVNVSNNKQTIIRRNLLRGAACGLRVDTQGNGNQLYEIPDGCRIEIYDNNVGHGCWGRAPGDPIRAYNAQRHGNGIAILSKYYFRLYLHDNVIDCNDGVLGGYQDMIEMGVASQCIFENNIIRGVGLQTTEPFWEPNGTGGWRRTTYNFVDGNQGANDGIKLGLGSFNGTGPDPWLALNGTPGGAFNIDQLGNIAVGNKIYDCHTGILCNNSGGHFIHGNEIYFTGNQGLMINTGTAGNAWVSNNYVEMSSSVLPSVAQCIRIVSPSRAWIYNNVFVSKAIGGKTTWDAISSGTIRAFDSNYCARSATSGITATNPKSGTLSWTQGVGHASGSPLKTAGSVVAVTGSRSYGANRDGNGNRWSAAGLPVGCYL